jgi:TolB-like protein
MRLVITVALALAGAAPASPARADDLPGAARKAADVLGTALLSGPDAGSVRQVALLPFTEGPGAAGLSRSVAAVLGARFAQVTRVKVVDPDALRTAVGEQKLAVMMGQGRADDPELLARSGAQATITGAVEVDGGRTRITARLVLGKGGRVLATAQAAADGVAKTPAAESGAIEVAMRRLTDGLASGFGRLPGSGRYRRLAVLTFAEVGERAQKRKLGTVVTAEVATNLRRDHGLLLVERARLTDVLSELKLQEMTAMDSAQASRVGQMADAQALVLGSVAEAGDRYLVTARIVATSTGEALAAESVSVADAGMTAIASDAVVLRSRGDAAMRSLLFPGLGQAYNRQPVKAIAFAGAEVALLGAALGYHLAGQSAWSAYKKVGPASGTNPSAEATRLYDRAESRFTTRNWLLLGGAAVWAVGVVDAYVSGVDGRALLGGGGVVAGAERRTPARVVVAPAVASAGAGVALAGTF